MVQFLVLAHAHQHPELTENIGNIALLRRLAELGVIEKEEANRVASAYLAFRKLQHASRLQGHSKAQVASSLVQDHVEAVKSLWNKLMV
jgi:glutamate-ammonia-ligase adenylyltransferase